MRAWPCAVYSLNRVFIFVSEIDVSFPIKVSFQTIQTRPTFTLIQCNVQITDSIFIIIIFLLLILLLLLTYKLFGIFIPVTIEVPTCTINLWLRCRNIFFDV